MAEGTTPGPGAPPPPGDLSSTDHYFCHQCKLTVGQVQNFACPRCGGGFLEKVDEEFAHEAPPHMPDFLAGSGETGGNPVQMDFRQLMQAMGPLFAGAPPAGINPAGPARGAAARSGQQDFEVPMFLQQLIERLGGEGVQFQVQFGGNNMPPLFGGGGGIHGNPADYAWGPGGLDQIVTQLLNAAETGPPPLTEQQIAEIPSVDVTDEHVERRVQCTTCMEEFAKGEKVRKLKCAHIFHPDCIIPWLKRNNTCPICRTVLAEPQPQTAAPPAGQPANPTAVLDQIDELD